ncbi:MAG TPA: rhodanese-like domain-containing protein [Opitutaceae bacterium]|nr:rhodanese-like domain-containing protein [Opitutaceae bacterium]
MSGSSVPLEISVATARELLDANPGQTLLLDVREVFERDICRLPGGLHIPMREIPENLSTLPRDRHILVLCHHGGRSRRVTEFLRHHGLDAVSNIAGGIDAWAAELDPALARY